MSNFRIIKMIQSNIKKAHRKIKKLMENQLEILIIYLYLRNLVNFKIRIQINYLIEMIK